VTVPRTALAIVLLVVAVVLELAALSRLPLPGSPPDLVLLVVVGMGLAWGPEPGALAGFTGGLLLDLAPPAIHPIGLWALVSCLIGYACGLLSRRTARSRPATWLVAAGSGVAGAVLFAALSALFGGGRVSAAALVEVLPALAGYDLLLAPVVVGAVMAMARRTGVPPARAQVSS
jgi:rod shape-determining protein MreD